MVTTRVVRDISLRASRKKIKENPVGVEDVPSHVSGTDIFEIVEITFPHQSVQGGGGEDEAERVGVCQRGGDAPPPRRKVAESPRPPRRRD